MDNDNNEYNNDNDNDNELTSHLDLELLKRMLFLKRNASRVQSIRPLN